MVRKATVYEPEVGAEALPLLEAPDDRPMSVVIHPLANVLKQRRRWLCFLWVLLLFHCAVAVILTVVLAVQPPIFGIGHNHTMDIDFDTYDFNQSLTDVALLCILRPLLLIVIYRAIQITANSPILLSSVATIAFLSVKFRHFELTRDSNHESIDTMEYMFFGVAFGFALLEIVYNWIFIQPMSTRVRAARKMWGNADVDVVASDDSSLGSIVVLPNQGGNVQASIALVHYEDVTAEGISPTSYYEDNVVVPPTLVLASTSSSSPLSERKLMEANSKYESAVPMYASARPRAQSGYSSNSGHSMYHTPDGSPDSHHGVEGVGFGTPDTSDEADAFKNNAQSHGDDKFGTPDSSLRGSPVTVLSQGETCDQTFGTPGNSPFSDSLVSPSTPAPNKFFAVQPIEDIGKNATQATWDMGMGDTTPWKSIMEVDGVTVSSCEDSTVKNGVDDSARLILKSESVIDQSIDKIKSLLTASFRKGRANQQPQNGQPSTSTLKPWGPIFDLHEVIENVDADTDLMYTTMSSQAGGLITSRDFVTVRKLEKRTQSVVIAESPVEHKARPETTETIRASLGPGGYILTSFESNPDTTRVVWILNVDLKAWLPALLLTQTMSDLVLKHHKQIREMCTTI